MGTDIHTHIEIREGGQWYHYNWRNEYVTGEGEYGPKYDWERLFEDPLWIGRSYDLFAILADVRNGYGFAGVPINSGFDVIDEPRGLPHDASEQTRDAAEGWEGCGHSHSWLTLKELLDFDWHGKTVGQIGYVSEREYKQFKENGEPSTWSGGVGGQRVIKVTNEKMDDIISGNVERGEDKVYYTQISWEWTYAESVGDRWFMTMEKLQELGDPEDVRIVFWFDN